MKAIEQYLATKDGKIVSAGILLVFFAAIWGFIKGREKALDACVDPYDFSDLPQGGNDLKEKVDSAGNVIKPVFTIDKARVLAKRGFDSWESYNPFKKNAGEILAGELLNLNDDELVLVCKVYLATYSEAMYASIMDDYFGLGGWASEFLDDDEYKLTKRLQRLNQI